MQLIIRELCVKTTTTKMELLGFKQILGRRPSTDKNTQIDLLFANFSQGITASYSESLLSYHKPILCTITKELLDNQK